MKQKKKIMVRTGIIGVLLIGTFMLVGMLSRPSVEAVRIEEGNIVSNVEETGEVKASNSSDIYASQSGRIAEVQAEIGQTVTRGQVLIRMESPDLQIEKESVSAQIAQANAAVNRALEAIVATELELEQAQAHLKRISALHEAGAVSTAEYDKAREQVHSSQKLLAQQNASLESYKAQAGSLVNMMNPIVKKKQELLQVSPVTGVVLTLKVKPQQVITQGTLLASVGSPNKLEVKADIIEDDLRDIKVGQKVVITSPVLDRKYILGKVQQIYPQAEEKASALGVVQRRVPVIINLESVANLKPGYEVRVAIETMRHNKVLMIPSETIRTLGNGDKQVTVVENGRTWFRKIETGISDKYNVEVIKGLKAGDVVIRDASQSFSEGQRVKAEID